MGISLLRLVFFGMDFSSPAEMGLLTSDYQHVIIAAVRNDLKAERRL